MQHHAGQPAERAYRSGPVTPMPFVERDANGRIVAVRLAADAAAGEFLSPEDPQILGFLDQVVLAGATGPADPPVDGFDALDADFVRVIEDVIDALISRNIINLTDLPVGAQSKLIQRKGLRDRMGRPALQLFGDDQDRGVI